MDYEIKELAAKLGDCLKSKQLKLAAAESCTGGGIAYAITEIAGSSDWFDRSFVTYSNEAKIELLSVNPGTLARHGAVSSETATEMVLGAMAHSHADGVIAVTGIAGPDGGSLDKPVGTVYIARLWRNKPVIVDRMLFSGSREEIRQHTILFVLKAVINDCQSINAG